MLKMKMSKTIFLALLFTCYGIESVRSSSKCDRTPEGSSSRKSPPSGGYKLKIVNEPTVYQPEELYNITLEKVIRGGQQPAAKFTGFYIIAEKDFTDGKQLGIASEHVQVGEFEIPQEYRNLAKISGKCDHLVSHSSSFSKDEITVFWKAPPKGKGCIVFKSTVIVHKDIWYSDDGALTVKICEDESEAGDVYPDILEECGACEEAKYELTFEGFWSRHTHPKDFPDNGWLTRFSDIIGATHIHSYKFWDFGETASEGLKELAEHGTTSKLEEELKDEGEKIRTIIKARGISYPNVNGKTFAVFRVDSKHHLVSLVSMISPSPDWFVGVSSLELCLPNNTWIEQKEINLYPLDAGTDSGPSYISPDQPTLPREAIRRIKPNQPNDQRSPFHDPENKEMKPLAKLMFTRQKLYDMNCEPADEEETVARNRDWNNEDTPDCRTSAWSAWSPCDATCGPGKRTRERQYLNRNSEKNCNERLFQDEFCQGDCSDNEQKENEEEEEEENEPNDPNCKLTDWEWSECTPKCGRGTKTGTRSYENERKTSHCQKKYNFPLEKIENCEENCDEESENPESCSVTEFTEWTACSLECGMGEKIRVRKPTDESFQNTEDENLKKIIDLYDQLNPTNDNDGQSDENNNEDQNDLEIDVGLLALKLMDISDKSHACYNISLIEKEHCGLNKSARDCSPPSLPQNMLPLYCNQLPLPGNCNGKPELRWFFNKERNFCGAFMYTGCFQEKKGRNNFVDFETCMDTCYREPRNSQKSSSKVNSSPRVDDIGNGLALIGVAERIDCKMTPWKHEPCNATCGEGTKVSHRSILQYPLNGGKLCGKLVRYQQCYKECEKSERMLPNPSALNQRQSNRCSYTEWNAWSPCSKTCGDNAVQIRTRTVLNSLNSHTCNERLEQRRCEVMPCLGGSYSSNYNYRT